MPRVRIEYNGGTVYGQLESYCSQVQLRMGDLTNYSGTDLVESFRGATLAEGVAFGVVKVEPGGKDVAGHFVLTAVNQMIREGSYCDDCEIPHLGTWKNWPCVTKKKRLAA